MFSKSKRSRAYSGGDDVQMRVEVFALCEHAADEDGRLTVLRTFEVVNATSVPLTLTEINVAIRLRFWPAEDRVHQFALHFINPDGVPAMEPVAGSFTVNPVNDDRACGYNLVMKFRELSCSHWGEHSFDFYLNHQLEARLPLFVNEQVAS